MEPFRHLPVSDGGLDATEDLYGRILCLPMANDLTGDELDAVAGVLEFGPKLDVARAAGATASEL